MNRAQDWLESFKVGGPAPLGMENQAREERKASAITISITSGKGGVGKTSIALKLGMELARTGKKVLLIDCDYNLSNTLLKLGLPINDNFYSYISSQKKFHECIYKRDNFHLLPGCNGSLGLFDEKFDFDKVAINIINEFDSYYDYILLDCPAGLSEKILNINAFCHQRFFILTPDKSSLTDSYSLIKILKLRYGIRENHLIVNRFVDDPQLRRVVKSITDTSMNFLGCTTHFLGAIREYENKLDSFDEILLFRPQSVIHKNFLKVINVYADKHGGPNLIV